MAIFPRPGNSLLSPILPSYGFEKSNGNFKRPDAGNWITALMRSGDRPELRSLLTAPLGLRRVG